MSAPQPTFSLAELAQLLTVALNRPTTDTNDEVFTLEEVAAMTKMSLRQIERDCRANRVEHVHQGHLRGMTRPQIAALIALYTEDAVNRPTTAAEEKARRTEAARQRLAAQTSRGGRRAA
jgi:hypothetical protein